MKAQKKIFTVIIFLVCFSSILLIPFFNTVFVRANSADPVKVTVKLSICGNEIVEGGEECDNSNLNHQTCETLGYDSGVLICSIACDFDTSSCSRDLGRILLEEESGALIDLLPEDSFPDSEKILPKAVAFFDLDNDGVIRRSELKKAIEEWLKEFKKEEGEEEGRCDLNIDGRCDLVDFSVLLYFVDRSKG